jgi:hypothetical protein
MTPQHQQLMTGLLDIAYRAGSVECTCVEQGCLVLAHALTLDAHQQRTLAFLFHDLSALTQPCEAGPTKTLVLAPKPDRHIANSHV